MWSFLPGLPARLHFPCVTKRGEGTVAKTRVGGMALCHDGGSFPSSFLKGNIPAETMGQLTTTYLRIAFKLEFGQDHFYFNLRQLPSSTIENSWIAFHYRSHSLTKHRIIAQQVNFSKSANRTMRDAVRLARGCSCIVGLTFESCVSVVQISYALFNLRIVSASNFPMHFAPQLCSNSWGVDEELYLPCVVHQAISN